MKQAAKRDENALGTATEWKSSSGISSIGVEFANAWDGLHFDSMNSVFISDLFPEHHRLLSSYSSPFSLKGSSVHASAYACTEYLSHPRKGICPDETVDVRLENGRRLWGIVNTAISVTPPFFFNTLFPPLWCVGVDTFGRAQ